MAFVNLVHFAERLFNQSSSSNNTADSSQPARRGNPGVSAPNAEDQFTPSNAPVTQEIGLFQTGQIAIFSAAADFLFAQATDQGTAANQPVANDANPSTATGPAQNPSSAGQTPSAPPIAQTAATTANTSDALQTLNSALAALGLPQEDISVIDRIATLIQDFNPVAFASLVQQLQTLAQVSSSQANAAAAFAATPAVAATANAGTTTGATAPPANTFQIQELSIRFAGINAQGTVSNAGATAQSAPQHGHVHFRRNHQGNFQAGAQSNTSNNVQNNFQFSAFSLQVEEVTLTLSNTNGQAVQIQAPPSAASASTTSATPQTKTASAATLS